MIKSHSCCRFVGCTSMMKISRYHVLKVLLDWDLVTEEPLSLKKNSLRWLELCDEVLEASISTVVINQARLLLRSPKIIKKISSTSSQHQQPEPSQGRMDPCFQDFLTPPYERCSWNPDSLDRVTFLQCSNVQFWWAGVGCSLSWVWSSAAGEHLLLGIPLHTCIFFYFFSTISNLPKMKTL